MKKTITILSALALSAGLSYAGCGKVDTTSGKITSYDAEKKIIVVEAEGNAPPPNLVLGRAALRDAGCSSISVDRRTRRLTLTCAG